jgi:hypothetical protein
MNRPNKLGSEIEDYEEKESEEQIAAASVTWSEINA